MASSNLSLVPIWEPLEGRILFDGFSASINFQPAKAPVPAGYLADTGASYGDRGNGYTYGWNGKLPALTREQNAANKANNGPDSRYDTFALLYPSGRGSNWQIAAPNGTYEVEIVVGSPIVFPARYIVEVQGSVFLSGTAKAHHQWIDDTNQVPVTDGMISITAPRGIIDRLDFITITQIITPPAPPTPPSPAPPPAAWTTPLVWNTEASAPVGLAEAMSVGVSGIMYVVGGYNVSTPNYLATTDAEAYDVATNTWSSIAPLPEPLTHSGIASDGSNIYVAGGYVTNYSTQEQTFGTTDVWKYNIATNTWSAFVSLPQPRGAGTMVIFSDELFYFGGVDPSRTGHTDLWALNLASSNPQWTAMSPMPATRNHMAGEVLDGMIYAVGGQPATNDSDPAADVFMYDPSTNDWTSVASLPTPLSHMAVGVIAGRIVVAGGTQTNDLPLDNVYSYDPSTDTWTEQTPIPSPRLAPVGAVIGDEFIVTTGYAFNNYQASFATDTWATIIG